MKLVKQKKTEYAGLAVTAPILVKFATAHDR